jgi:hypothetical protein
MQMHASAHVRTNSHVRVPALTPLKTAQTGDAPDRGDQAHHASTRQRQGRRGRLQQPAPSAGRLRARRLLRQPAHPAAGPGAGWLRSRARRVLTAQPHNGLVSLPLHKSTAQPDNARLVPPLPSPGPREAPTPQSMHVHSPFPCCVCHKAILASFACTSSPTCMRAHTHSLTLTHTHTYTHAHPHKALPPNPLQVAEQQGRYLAAMLNEEAKNTGAEPKDFVYNHLVRSGGVMGAGRGVLGVSVAS